MDGNEQQAAAQSQSRPPDAVSSLGSDIFARARPYLVEIGKDGLVSASIYVTLFLFEMLFELLPLRHKAGDFFAYVHSVALFALLAVFAWLSIIDVLRIHRRESK